MVTGSSRWRIEGMEAVAALETTRCQSFLLTRANPSALGLVHERADGNPPRRWLSRRACAAATSGRICLRYLCPRFATARYSRCFASPGRQSLRCVITDVHSTSRKRPRSLPTRLVRRSSGSGKPAPPNLEATGGGCSSNEETDSNEPGAGGEDGTAATRKTLGAVCLIIGTSIGSGILALPQRTSPAGFIPSASSMIICWGFLLLEALLIAEVNVSLLNMNTRKKPVAAEVTTAKDYNDSNLVVKGGQQQLETISFRTMAVETLGELGGSIATVTYVFLGYTSLIAYCSKSGELLSQIVSLPPALLGSSFTALTAILICFGGYRVADGVNQWLTAVMIGLLVIIEVTAASVDNGSLGTGMVLAASDDWSKVPPIIPLLIFSLVYHDITPVICSYLDGDLSRIRFCMVIGSLVPLLCLVVWDAVMLGLPGVSSDVTTGALGMVPSPNFGVSSFFTAAQVLVEPFSLLAVGTSLIGTLLGFSSFFQEQIRSRYKKQEGGLHASSSAHDHADNSLVIGLLAMAAAVVPALLTSASLADAFDMATDFAGGYCMTVLYGVLPPAMAWSLQFKKQEGGYRPNMKREEVKAGDGSSRSKLLQAKPTLIGAGLFASGVAVLQVVNDCSSLIPSLGLFN